MLALLLPFPFAVADAVHTSAVVCTCLLTSLAAVLHAGIESLLGVVETVANIPGALVSVKPSWWL